MTLIEKITIPIFRNTSYIESINKTFLDEWIKKSRATFDQDWSALFGQSNVDKVGGSYIK
jgi:hypothetical protein